MLLIGKNTIKCTRKGFISKPTQPPQSLRLPSFGKWKQCENYSTSFCCFYTKSRFGKLCSSAVFQAPWLFLQCAGSQHGQLPSLTHVQLSRTREEAPGSLCSFHSLLTTCNWGKFKADKNKPLFSQLQTGRVGGVRQKRNSDGNENGHLPAEDKGTEFQNTVLRHKNVD